MRRIAVAGFIVGMLGAGVLAAPDPKPASTWADWAGSYQGTLTWSGCTVAGVKTATVELAFVDGVATIDLASTRPGMRAMTLAAGERDVWAGRQGDVAATITRVPNTIFLAVDLDSGCRVRGRLTRATTGVPACDQLVGWTRVEAQCTKLVARTEDLAKLLATAWKPADAARCASRAATLERTLIDGGCAPHPDPQIGARAPDCLDLAQVAERINRCGVPAHVKDITLRVANALVSAAQSAERSTLPVVEHQCRDARADLISIATQFRCP